jgi:type VI secretion system protein ImpK
VESGARSPVPSGRWFQEFAQELLAQRRSVQSRAQPIEGPALVAAAAAGASGTSTASAPASQTAPEVPGDATTTALAPASDHMASTAAAVRASLIALLDRQLAEATRLGGPVSLEYYRSALYAMTALADEVFVRLPWDGRGFWLRNLLESHYFGSQFAGDGFFARADDLIYRRDEAAAGIAPAYLMALALGFRGKFYGPSGDRPLAVYRTNLFDLVARYDPELASSKFLFAAAYEHTLHGGAPRRFANVRLWTAVLALVVVGWVVFAHFFWRGLTADLETKLESLQKRPAAVEGPQEPKPSPVAEMH